MFTELKRTVGFLSLGFFFLNPGLFLFFLLFFFSIYLNINDQEYQIAANEFVTSKSLLSTDYFKELKPHTYKQYGQNVPFENSDPARPFIRNPVKWSDEFDKIELAD